MSSYKGNSFIDAGYFYAPYIPLISTPHESTRLPECLARALHDDLVAAVGFDFEFTAGDPMCFSLIPVAGTAMIQILWQQPTTVYHSHDSSSVVAGRVDVVDPEYWQNLLDIVSHPKFGVRFDSQMRRTL